MAKFTPFARLRPITALLVLLQITTVASVSLNTNSADSIKKAARSLAEDIMSQYENRADKTPGLLPSYGTPDGYYWWVGGGMFGTMLNYWIHTGDDTWNDEMKEAIIYQSAPDEGGYFEPFRQRNQLGNDDISFWAFAAMEAAEYKFSNPPPHQYQWLEMVQAVFNRQAYRIDNVCGGGLRWQVNFAAPGYQFKNSISNGCFFQIGARLGKYTGNHTYFDHATKIFDWMRSNKLIRDDYSVIDGLWANDNCRWQNSTEQWSYNVGVLLYGAACIWNATGDAEWKKHTQGFLDATKQYMNTSEVTGKDVLTETLCEPYSNCKTDATTFKSYLARWMRETALVAPWISQQVYDTLQPSAIAAAGVCTQPGQFDGMSCGQKWYTGEFDGIVGIGQNMNAMEVIHTLLPAPGPVNDSQGTSKGNPSGGGGGSIYIDPGDGTDLILDQVTTADKAGAAIITILLAAATFSGAWWIIK